MRLMKIAKMEVIMKKLILLTALFGATSSYAFDAQLEQNTSMTVDELLTSGATTVSCEPTSPLCVLKGTQYGIRYEGQSIEDVHLTDVYNTDRAVKKLKELRDEGFCK